MGYFRPTGPVRASALTEAAAHAATGRYALAWTFRLVKGDPALAPKAAEAGKAVSGLLQAIEARRRSK